MGKRTWFPDINTLEPLADALGIEVVELMRSEINTERRETAVDRKNVVEIMKSTAEISEYHAAKKMKWLISGISFVMAVLGVMVTQSTKVFSSIAFYGCIIGCTTCVVLLRQYWEIREKKGILFFTYLVSGGSQSDMDVPVVFDKSNKQYHGCGEHSYW